MCFGLVASTTLACSAAWAASPVVAVFEERGFPYFGANQAVSPRIVAEMLELCGLATVRMDTDQIVGGGLRKPALRCLIWCYGNTFPREAERAITEFHERGGCIVATGVPFTHPCMREELRGRKVWRDCGHEDYGGHDRVGVGQVGGSVARGSAVFVPAPNAPLALQTMRESASAFDYIVPSGMGVVFYPGRDCLPVGDELVGIVGVEDHGVLRGWPVAAIKHYCQRFNGAIDVWAGTQWLSDPRDPAQVLLLRQLLVRSAIYALDASGAITRAQRANAEHKLNQWCDAHLIPARLPTRYRPRTTRRLFPRCPTVSRHEIIIVHNVTAEDQHTRLALACLQGLVNRTSPRLYLVYTPHDEAWLRWYQQRGYVGPSIRQVSDAGEVVSFFRSATTGAILADDRYRNIGTMLASVRDGVVCTDQQARRWRLPVIADLRGKWTSDASAYEWAFRELWPRMRHDVLCSGHPERSAQQTDYLVAHRVFTFFVSGAVDGADQGKDPAAETALAEKLMAAAEPHSPVMGWWAWSDPPEGIGEYWGMTLGSRYAKLTVGTEFMTNMSFHTGIPAPDHLRQTQIDRLVLPSFDPTRVYVSLNVLDSGNDPWYWLRPQREVWEAPGRGETPTGWIIGVGLLDLAPGVVEWYYDHLTERDELICGLSGLGYMNVPDYGIAYSDRGRVLEDYLALTQGYLDRLDLRTVQTYHGSWGEPSDFRTDGDLALFARTLRGVRAFLPDVGRHEMTTPEVANYVLPGPQPATSVPVFHCLTRWIPWTLSGDLTMRREDTEVANLVGEIRRMTPTERPGFMNVFVLSWTFKPQMINRAAAELGEPYVFVSPSQMAELYLQHLNPASDLQHDPHSIRR